MMATLITDTNSDPDKSPGNILASNNEYFEPRRISSFDSNEVDSESDDDLPDSYAADIKIQALSIVKIDIGHFENNTVDKIENLEKAEDIIKKIVGKRTREDKQAFEPIKHTVDGDLERSENVEAPAKDSLLFHEDNGSEGDDNLRTLTTEKPDVGKFDDNILVVDNLESLEKEGNLDIVVRKRKRQDEHVIKRTQKKCKTETRLRRKELHLGQEIENELSKQENSYHLKCFLFQKDGFSALTKSFLGLVTKEDQKLLKTTKHVVNSFLLFFYRNVEYKGVDKIIRPEIFTAYAGFASKLVVKLADIQFTAQIERRLLKFPFRQVESTFHTGPVYKRTEMARSGQCILFDVWQYLDVIVGNRTRELRENASLYSEGLGGFCNDQGKPLPILFDIKVKSIKIRRSLTLTQLGSTLMHLSKIHMGTRTFSISDGQEEETDDPAFQIQDSIGGITSPKLRNDLNKELYRIMEGSMNSQEKTFLYLTNKDMEKWIRAESISLSAQKRDNIRRSLLKQWSKPPTLDEILECLQEKCGFDKFNPEWLESVQIKFGGKAKPLKEFIFATLPLRGMGTYIYYYGTWLEITTHYLYLIEMHFTELLSEYWIEASGIHLMPWKHQKGNDAKAEISDGDREYHLKSFDFHSVEGGWKRHLHSIRLHEKLDNVETVICKTVLDDKTNVVRDGKLKIRDITKWSPCEVAYHLYLLHECKLMEEDFNASHALLDKLLDGSEWNMITCDKIEPHGIELCDILIWNEETTYLVHVKSGFKGSAVRDVCSQIRNSADQIYRNQMSTSGTGILDTYWKMLTESASQNGFHQIPAKNKLEKMGFEKFKALFDINHNIVFVLACRDNRKGVNFKDEVGYHFNVKMENEIKERLPVADPPKVIAKLKKEGYLTKCGNLTNKFILEGKDNKTKFIQTMKNWEEVGSEKVAQKLSDILTAGLSKSKSTIAKMEIIRLCQDFKRYCVRPKKFQLKITSVDHDYPK